MVGVERSDGAASWIEDLEAEGLAPRRDDPLGERTTYRVGGTAAALVEVADVDDLIAIGRVRARTPMDVAVIGKGSNLIVADEGFDGLVVVTGEAMSAVEVDGVRVRCGAGALLPVVARQSVAAGLTGFEWAVGVPGSIGGAVRMNAGGHGADMADSLVEVRVVDLDTGQDVTMAASALRLSYRSSSLTAHQVVVAATLELEPGDPREGSRRLKEIVAWRRAHQPGGPNAGSVFTNPPGDSAGRLIDAAGLKGRRVGGAVVSAKHANFIQAEPGAAAADVLALMAVVRDEVRRVHGVDLVAETIVLGGEEAPRRAAGVRS